MKDSTTTTGQSLKTNPSTGTTDFKELKSMDAFSMRLYSQELRQ